MDKYNKRHLEFGRFDLIRILRCSRTCLNVYAGCYGKFKGLFSLENSILEINAVHLVLGSTRFPRYRPRRISFFQTKLSLHRYCYYYYSCYYNYHYYLLSILYWTLPVHVRKRVYFSKIANVHFPVCHTPVSGIFTNSNLIILCF